MNNFISSRPLKFLVHAIGCFGTGFGLHVRHRVFQKIGKKQVPKLPPHKSKKIVFFLLLDLCGGKTFFSDVVVFFRLLELCDSNN